MKLTNNTYRKMSGDYVPAGYVEAPEGEGEEQSGLRAPDENEVLVPQQGEQHWNSGICAIYDDIPICCLGCWCPCVLFGRNVEMLEGKPWVGPCVIHFLLWSVATVGCCILTEGTFVGLLGSCVPCYACNYRKAMRAKYNLEDAPFGDLLTHACCHLCANCQEYRELVAQTPVDHGLPVVLPPPIQTMGASSAGRTGTSPQNELDAFPN